VNPSLPRMIKFNSTSRSFSVPSRRLCGIDAGVNGCASQGIAATPGAVMKKCWPARHDERRFFDRRIESFTVWLESRSIEDTPSSVLASLDEDGDGRETILIQMSRENLRQRSNAQKTKPGQTRAFTEGWCMMTPNMKILTRCHFVNGKNRRLVSTAKYLPYENDVAHEENLICEFSNRPQGEYEGKRQRNHRRQSPSHLVVVLTETQRRQQ
jgi:hypothetical protein